MQICTDCSTLTLLDLDEKLSALSHSAAAAFITARIKALSLTLP